MFKKNTAIPFMVIKNNFLPALIQRILYNVFTLLKKDPYILTASMLMTPLPLEAVSGIPASQVPQFWERVCLR